MRYVSSHVCISGTRQVCTIYRLLISMTISVFAIIQRSQETSFDFDVDGI